MIFFNDESNALKLESDLESRGQDIVRIGERTDELERRMSVAEQRIVQLAELIVSGSGVPATRPTQMPVDPLQSRANPASVEHNPMPGKVGNKPTPVRVNPLLGATMSGTPIQATPASPAIPAALPATPRSATERQGQIERALPTTGRGTDVENPQIQPASTCDDYIPVLRPHPPEGKYPDPPAEPGEGVKYCPAAKALGNDAEMLPCLLYGIEVDLSDAGIYFEANELVGVLRETKNQTNMQGFLDAVKTLGSSKLWGENLQNRITEARMARGEYQRVRADWEQAEQELSRLEQEANRLRAPEAAHALQNAQAEFRRCADMELRLRASRRIDITPAFSGEKLDLPNDRAEANEKPKGDPAEPDVNMIKIKIHDDILDISSTGIWFDPGELVDFLKGVKKAGGLFSGFKKEDYQATIMDTVNELAETVKRQQGIFEDYRGLTGSAKKHPTNSDKHKELKREAGKFYAEYAELNQRLSEPKDLTPKLSFKEKLPWNK